MDATMDAAADATVTSRSRRAKNDAAAASASAAVRRPPPRDAGFGSRASTRREMRRERDAACLRAASDARRAACARLREGLAVASAALDAARGDGPGAARGRCSSSSRTQGVDGRGDGVRGDVLGGAAIRARGAHGVSAQRGGGVTRRGNQPARDVSSSRRGGAARARGTTRPESARRARGGDSVAPTTRGGCIRAEARGGAAARATRERRETRASRRAAHVRTSAYMRASTREGVDVLDATGHGGVYASEASNAKPARFGTGIAPDEEALRASLAKFPDAEPLDALLAAREREMLAREAARRAEKAEAGVGVEALGASDEASWSAYAPAHGASVLEVDDANDDATSNANDDATSNDAPSDPDAIERRKAATRFWPSRTRVCWTSRRREWRTPIVCTRAIPCAARRSRAPRSRPIRRASSFAISRLENGTGNASPSRTCRTTRRRFA